VSCLTNVFATVNAVTGQFAPVRSARVVGGLTVGVEVALLAVAAILYTALWAVGEGPARDLSLGLAVVCAGAAIGLGLLSRALWQARRWAVSPALTWQVLQGLAGAYALANGEVIVGAVALGLALVGAVAIGLVARAVASTG
jgi:hypothetical protein